MLKHSPGVLEEWYEAAAMPDFALHYNICPGNLIVTVRAAPQGRIGALMRWGFIPAWAKDPASLPMLHNARGETVAEKPMFRQAFRRRRCLIPASGFYEWKAVPGQKSKQPFYASFKDGSPMSFAGLWERSKTADGDVLDSCAVITTGANRMLEPIHDRMPVILDRGDWAAWLDTEAFAAQRLLALIRPFPEEAMQAWGVSHAVNRVTNDEPKLLRPIA